jgi:hypothetical protein
MRYNNYLNDPIFIINATGEREPAQGIAARYDLRGPNGTVWGAKNHFAGLDSKTVRYSAFTQNGEFDAILSPTYDDVPAFTFDDWPGIGHTGLATLWKFPWMTFVPEDRCNFTGKEASCLDLDGCGWCTYSQECYRGTKAGPTFQGKTCEAGWKVKTILQKWAIPIIVVVSVLGLGFVIVVLVLAYRYQKRREPAAYRIP